MSLIETSFDSFIEKQKERVDSEIEYWDNFRRDHPEGVYYAFSEQHKDGQLYKRGNRFPEDREQAVYDYLKLPDVYEIDDIIVDAQALQIPYNCMHKSCRLTGLYCCKVTKCTANTEMSQEVMREAGRHVVDKFEDPERAEAIRRGNTHTPKLAHNRTIDHRCVFGDELHDEDPETGEEHPHIHCRLHEAAYENKVPLHYLHSIGPSLFPADINIVDGKWFLTAASERAVERRVTRWYTMANKPICVKHGDTSGNAILQHPDFDSLYAHVLGREKLETVREEIYGDWQPKLPDIQDGWLHAEERGLTPSDTECRNCDGAGCDKCDQRGWFRSWNQ